MTNEKECGFAKTRTFKDHRWRMVVVANNKGVWL